MSDPIQQIFTGLEVRRIEVARLIEVAPGIYTSDFFVTTQGSGECYAALVFPVTYTEVPMMTFGGEMAPNQMILPGQAPLYSAVVHSWKSTRRPDYGARLYGGASLVLAITGPATLVMTLHVSFHGKSISNVSS